MESCCLENQEKRCKNSKRPSKTMEILCPSLLFLNVRGTRTRVCIDVNIMRTDKVTLAGVVVHLSGPRQDGGEG